MFGLFVVFSLSLMNDGKVATASESFILLLGAWAFGLMVLVAWPTWVQRPDDRLVILSRSIWCNVGAVALAVLVTDPFRMLLLAVVIFGIFYVSMHMDRRAVMLATAVTWLAYNLAVFMLGTATELSVGFELTSYIAFTVMLAGAGFVASEVLRVRDSLQEQTDSLRVLTERMQELALQDELTGVHNRRNILELLDRQKALADRGVEGFSVCYCDLDYFKELNDRFGHATGDTALRMFAQVALSVVRNVDYVARIGGEEFLLLLVNTRKQSADRVAQRLVERTLTLQPLPEEPECTVSVSVGVASYEAPESIDDLLRRADVALYRAKQSGRSRVVSSA